ncbi:HEAT repeat protein [Planctomycetes bacterium Pan216]|uniref:ADP,ATP carrier protein n=1 Tax=Kolteria novifilia TaxID=2527975 RepID=A0A518BB65_9BACT|nr:HEAT repeat protein [Planctomycetes bacterium Pan216]
MTRFLERLFQIRQRDVLKVLLLQWFAFGSTGAYIVGRTIGDSLFLSEAGPEWLPELIVLSSFVVVAAALFNTRCVASCRLISVIRVTLVLMAISSVALRELLVSGSGGLLVVSLVYIAAEIRGALSSVQFATLVNEVFDSGEPKRVFGFIPLGATLAGIIIGSSIEGMVDTFGSINLLFVIAGIELTMLIPLALLGKQTGPSPRVSPGPRKSASASMVADILTVMRTRYARSMAFLIAATVMVGVIVQFQWKTSAAYYFDDDANELTTYFGIYYGVVGVLTGLTQLFFSGRVLRRFHLIVSLLLFPSALVGAMATILISSREVVLLWAATLARGCDVLKRTVNEPAIQLLYWPLPSVVRRQTISLVGGIVKPLAEATSGMMILGLTNIISARDLSYVAFGLLAYWIYQATRCRKLYLETLSRSIRAHRLELDGQEFLLSASMLSQVRERMGSDQDADIHACLDLLEEGKVTDFEPTLIAVLGRANPDLRRRAVNLLGLTRSKRHADNVRPLLKDPDVSVRAAAVKAYRRMMGQHAQKELRKMTNDPDVEVRGEVMANLVKAVGWKKSQFSIKDLRKLVRAKDERTKLVGLNVIEEIYQPSMETLLTEALHDESFRVVRRAIDVVGHLRNETFVDHLIDLLRQPTTATPAVHALACYGKKVIPHLTRRLSDPRYPATIRAETCRVLKRIPCKQSLAALLGAIEDESEEVRDEAISATRRIFAVRQITLAQPVSDRLAKLYHQEIHSYFQQLLDIHTIESFDDPGLLSEALRHAATKSVDRVLHLLAIRHPEGDFETIALSLRSPSSRLRAMGRELLDHTVDDENRLPVLTMLSDLRCEEKLLVGRDYFRLEEKSVELLLHSLLHSPNEWIRAATLYHLRQGRSSRLLDDIVASLADASLMVRQAALQALLIMRNRPKNKDIRTILKNNGDTKLLAFLESGSASEPEPCPAPATPGEGNDEPT